MPPIDYSLYPPNWKTEIRPRILARANNCCEWCKAPNHAIVCRGEWGGVEVWQNDDGQIYSAKNGEYLGDSYCGDVWTKEQRLTKIVLTIAHLDHDKSNFDISDERLAALCQKCHLGHDMPRHIENRKITMAERKGQTKIEF